MRVGILGCILLIFGIAAILVGVEPLPAVESLWNRVWPILLFVAAITIVAVLAAEAGVFASAATRLAKWGAGRGWLLWLLVCALCVVTTVFFSLDTTAVLVTPAVVALTLRTGFRAMPFALTTIWLANSASLLLPVSNLTNLLAQQSSGLTVGEYFLLSWAPAIVGVVVPMFIIAIVFRRDLGARFTSTANAPFPDRILFTIAVFVLTALLPALVSGIPVWIPACIAAVILVVAFALRRPDLVRVGVVPWSLLLFAAGLFLVMDAAHQIGPGGLFTVAGGDGTGFASLVRLAGVGAASSNAVNNLPAYLALEPVAAGHSARTVALLVGTNCGALITPWASLATLLWHHRLTSMSVRIQWGRYVALGAIAAPLTVISSVAALVLISGAEW